MRQRLREARLITTQHRGVRSDVWTWRHALGLLAVLLLQWLLVLALYAWVQEGWRQVLAWAWPQLGLGSSTQVSLVRESLWSLNVPIVKVRVDTPTPQVWQWWLSATGAVGLLAGSFAISRERLPLIYLMRTVGGLWLLGMVLHESFTDTSNLSLAHVLSDLLKVGAVMLWLLPPLHALVLYIFPLPAGLKIAATIAALAFVALFVPLQVVALAWVVHQAGNLVLLPLYMLATFLPHVATQLGIYGYFMSLADVTR
ncbi:MAG: hypothetical protein Q4G71_16230 [Pseudomonadota bacterium]|nr:hypothetical protein [Pseudomonadota bacterium]